MKEELRPKDYRIIEGHEAKEDAKVCAIALQAEARFGKNATCHPYQNGYLCEYHDDPHLKCSWGEVCAECGQPRMWCYDQCAGQNLLCINLECVVDK